MIDWDRVDELRDAIGKEDFDEVVEIFLEEVEEVITLIRGDVASDQIESHLHFLKGSALNLGFHDFSALCQTGESTAARGQFDQIDLPSIVTCYEQSKAGFLSALADRHAA